MAIADQRRFTQKHTTGKTSVPVHGNQGGYQPNGSKFVSQAWSQECSVVGKKQHRAKDADNRAGKNAKERKNGRERRKETERTGENSLRCSRTLILSGEKKNVPPFVRANRRNEWTDCKQNYLPIDASKLLLVDDASRAGLVKRPRLHEEHVNDVRMINDRAGLLFLFFFFFLKSLRHPLTITER